MGSINSRPLKAYVRFDGSGRIVAGSLILRKNKPKVGKWKEIPAYECCNAVPTTTTTSTSAPITTTTTTVAPTTTTTTTPIVEAVCETLGRAATFAILGAETVTNTGGTVITGDLGLYPGTSATGFPPGIVNGVEHITDTQAQDAQTDANAAFICLNAIPTVMPLSGTLNGGTLGPNVYEASSSLSVINVTFNAGGNPDAVFIVKTGSTLIFENDSEVLLTNGAQACNIYWVVGSSATLGTNSSVLGNIIADISVTINTGAELTGRAFALTGAVTMDTNSIANCNCTSNPCAPTPTTTTTSTTVAPTTTTTTTTPAGNVSWEMAVSNISAEDACNGGSSTVTLYTLEPMLDLGVVLYIDSELSITVTDGFYAYSEGITSYGVTGGAGEITSAIACP